MSLKNPVTPQGIDPGTVRLVEQRLNHYATPGPVTVGVLGKLSAFYEAGSPGSCSQTLATDPCTKPTVSSHRPVSFRFVFVLFFRIWGRDVVVRVATHNGLDCSGFDPRRGKDFVFSLPVQTGPGAHPATYTMGNGYLFPGLKRPGRDVDHPPLHLVPRLRMRGAAPQSPP